VRGRVGFTLREMLPSVLNNRRRFSPSCGLKQPVGGPGL
jgi:hypothetical protein